MAAVNGAAVPARLHYIFDPLCGWCYAAAPLIDVARRVPGLAIAFHGGGMMTGENRRAITPQWRAYVIPHDKRIAQLTGQPFGDAYFDGLLKDAGAVMDSAPPTTAILAAEDVAARGLDMLHRLQQAHYVEGRRIADPKVLQDVAASLGLDMQAFAAAFERLGGAPTLQHIAASRRLLASAGGQGFPSFILQDADGALNLVDLGRWLGKAEAWGEHLTQLLAASRRSVTGPIDDTVDTEPCGTDACRVQAATTPPALPPT